VLDELHPLACASPDGLILPGASGEMIVNTEAKNVGRWMSGQWDPEDDSDEGVPMYYVAQCVWQVGVMRHGNLDTPDGIRVRDAISSRSDLVACIEGQKPRCFHVPGDESSYGALYEIVAKFDRDHVKAGVAPKGWEQEGERALGYVARRWRKSNGEMVVGTVSDSIMWEALKAAKIATKEAGLQVAKWRALLSERIGNADGLEFNGTTLITWKSGKQGKLECDWKAAMDSIALVVQAKAPHLAQEFQKCVDAAVAPRPGHRTFLVKGMPRAGKDDE